MENVDDDERPNFMTPLLTPFPSEGRQTQSDQQMNDLNRSLEQRLNFLYPAVNIENYDTESESDVQEQQPTEATDDSIDILPNPLPKDSDQTKLDIVPFNAQPSHDRDDICSPSQDIEPTDESFSGVVPDLDAIYEQKPTDSSNIVYSESLCVPYSDEKDEISLLKQTLTSTTTTITTEYFEPKKKDKDDLGHIMISYNHSTKALCTRIAKALKSLNYHVWIDQENISGDIFCSMASAIENSFVMLMAVNEQYYKSRYCRLEAEYAVERNKAAIPMLMQTGYKAVGWLGLINGSKLHIDFSTLQFDEAFNLLLREIEAIRISLGGDVCDQTAVSTTTQSMTTMTSYWMPQKHAQEWTPDDVFDWLHQQKLEIFEPVLAGFTGVALYQLYKIKLDSPPDFYRTIEQLLSPTAPRRLLYNLSFIAALESLFSHQIK